MAKLSMRGSHPHLHFHANEFHLVTRALPEAKSEPIHVVERGGSLQLSYGGSHTAVTLPDFHVALPVDRQTFPIQREDAYVTLRRRDDGIALDVSTTPLSPSARAVLEESGDFLAGKRKPMRRSPSPTTIQPMPQVAAAATGTGFRSRRERAFG